ncbi:hypothetical protein ACFVJM_37050 [Streptomyces virginiae]|uniref:ATP-dependent DNA ligase n=1 Tax=Streptomyces virginiae TaxID=1961 RepID=UPI00363750B4
MAWSSMGELVVWDAEAERLSFEALERRATTRARGAAGLAARWPAYFVAFDLLQQDGQELLTRPYAERRALLENLFSEHALAAPWTLCPMTTDLAKAREWLESWTDVSGVDQGQKAGHHGDDRRRDHRHPDPPAAPRPRPPRPGRPASIFRRCARLSLALTGRNLLCPYRRAGAAG